ncbi:MAG: DNA primase [Desulfamplus sp.]|nr:DNA primase [Desulfamplus sp.]
MFIPEEKISEILNVSDIIEVISDFVSLKKAGSNYVGLCPFHSEKTPSFSVSPQKQIFHCFGCSAGGNVFSFLMKHQGISFPEAANILATKYGIAFEREELSIEDRQKLQLKEALFRVNTKVKEYYSEELKKSPSAALARGYLERRLITQEIIDEFGIGYAPNRWDSVVSLLRKMKLSKSMAENSGLVLQKKESGKENNSKWYYDRFRNRIIFPIFDVNMQIAGFGGRVMDDSMPKYLNSPETPLYSKGKILYGLHAAKRYCRQTGQVYIVEGYFDFLSLYQSGIKNCVATLGTALTPYHVRLIKPYISKIFFVFDSDDAGVNASKRGVQLFIKEGIALRIVILPTGDDPDSFVTKYGSKAFEDFATKAISAIEFLTEMSIKKHGLSIEGKVAILEEIKDYLLAIQDNTLRSLYVREVAYRIGVDEEVIFEKVKKNLVNSANLSSSYKTPLANSNSTPLLPPPSVEKFIPREQQLISIMLQFPDIIEQIKKSDVLKFLYSSKLKEIGNLILTVADSLYEKSSYVNKTGTYDDKIICDISTGSYNNISTLVGDVMASAKNEADKELVASLAMMEMENLNNNIIEKSLLLIKRIIHIRKRDESKLIHEIRKIELLNRGTQSNRSQEKKFGYDLQEGTHLSSQQKLNEEKNSDMDLTLELLRQRQIEIRQLHGYE